MPVGSTEAVPIDVRIICATNKPLEKMIETGEFREDLYYRLNVFPINIPPLRERKDDIEAISIYLLNQYNDYYGRNVSSIEPAAIKLLQQSDWLGNVRELENILSRALINMTEDEQVLTKEEIKLQFTGKGEGLRRAKRGSNTSENILENLPADLHAALETMETMCIKRAIDECNGDKNKAAVQLGIPVRTLYYKCKKLDI
jgi:transcriptional regulator with PAS, ATPase and Fis domain